jgi:ATP-dependent protease ClpP protease subunit
MAQQGRGQQTPKAPKGMPPQQQRPPQTGAPVAQTGGPEQLLDEIEKKIQPVLGQLEAIRGHPVLAYYFDEGAQLGDEQMLWLYEHLRRIGRQPKVSLWLYSRGGSTVVPVKVVQLIREFCDEFAVLVPYRAHSASTHIALGADEIVMTEMSELGPVDPSRTHPLLPRVKARDGTEMPFAVSVQDLRHVLSFIEREIGKEEMTPDAAATIYTALFDKVHPLAIGGLEQSYELAHQVSEAVLGTHMDPKADADEIHRIATRMGDTYKDHTYPVSRREAKAVGLKVSDATPDETDAMWALFTAYYTIGLGGEGEVNGQKARLARVAHIDSRCGVSLGVQLTSITDANIQATNWHTKWLTAPKKAGT